MSEPVAASRHTHARLAPRRSPRLRSWWAKAWQRGVEEAAFSESDLRAARALARGGAVGGITVEPGALLAAVREADDAWTAQVAVPVLDEAGRAAMVEVVAAESGRVAALLRGELPHDLVEHAEEAGVELLPYGSELGAACTCPAVLDPCPHALAVLLQVGWLCDDAPFVLLALRGLPREELLRRLHARDRAGRPTPDDERLDLAVETDLDTAADAVRRARAALEALEAGRDPGPLLA